MLRSTILPVVIFLVLVSLNGSIGGTLPRTGVRPQRLHGQVAPPGDLRKNISNAHSGSPGHTKHQEQHSPSITHTKGKNGKPVNGAVEANHIVPANRLRVTHGSKGLDRMQDPPKNISSLNPLETASMPQSNGIAFSVTNSGPDQGPYPDVKIVTFNKVITNIGGGFDTQTSMFTCKVSGLYFFSVSLMAGFYEGPFGRVDHPAYIFLVRDGRNIFDAYGHAKDGTAVGTVDIHLVAGSRVWINLNRPGGDSKFMVRGKHSTFSGYLVKPDQAF